jgi:hypothetical protein
MLKRLIGKCAAAVAEVFESEDVREDEDAHAHAHGHGHGHEHEHGHRHCHARARRHSGKCCSECEIHGTSCPPRCVGSVSWKVERGAGAVATIEVRNVGTAARQFAFSATALAGPTPGTAALTVSPATAMLQPGDRAVVQVSLQNSSSLQPCQSYHAEVLIRGSWEQCVKVACYVEADPFSSVQVEQGDSIKDRIASLGNGKAAVFWKIQRGVVPKAAITVHNTGAALQTFDLETTPLVGLNSEGATLTLAPVAIDLSAGQTATAFLDLQNSASLQQGQDYRAEIVIRGFQEQRLELRCHVRHDAAVHLAMEQGDAPTRMRPHRWTDHFQCTDGCAPQVT